MFICFILKFVFFIYFFFKKNKKNKTKQKALLGEFRRQNTSLEEKIQLEKTKKKDSVETRIAEL